MLIIFHTSAAFPTEKAYGVTISETINAAKKLGHQTEHIFRPKSLDIKFRLINFKAFFKKRKTLYLIGKFKHCLTSKNQIITKTPDIVWTRDIFLAKFLDKQKFVTLVEIHKPLSLIELLLLKLSVPNKVILAPISRELLDDVSAKTKLKFRIIYLPMASQRIISNHCAQSPFPKIGYVGSFKSNSNDQGVEDLFNNYLQLSKFIKSELWLVGIKSDGVKSIKKSIASIVDVPYREFVIQNVKLIQHIPHSKVMDLLKGFDILAVPHPDGEYSKYKFPIKIVEYALSKRPIIITNTKSHKNIITQEEAWFYNFGNPIDFIRQIATIMNNPTSTHAKCEAAFKKFEKYTYENRVINALEFCLIDKEQFSDKY